MVNEDKAQEQKVKSLISTGSEIAGNAIGETLAFLCGGAVGGTLGGPVGAAVGGAVGVTISKTSTKLLSDFADRFLSSREEVRVGGTAALAISKIKDYLDAGMLPRDDNFFTDQDGKRTNAEEIFEGVLLKSKNEHEEKKAIIYANIFAKVAFDSDISLGEANYVIQIAENLTYRQICVLSLIGKKKQNQGINLRSNNYCSLEEETPESIFLLGIEIHRMYALNLVSGKGIPTAWQLIIPDELTLGSMGNICYYFMGLEDIPEEDIKDVEMYLK